MKAINLLKKIDEALKACIGIITATLISAFVLLGPLYYIYTSIDEIKEIEDTTLYFFILIGFPFYIGIIHLWLEMAISTLEDLERLDGNIYELAHSW